MHAKGTCLDQAAGTVKCGSSPSSSEKSKCLSDGLHCAQEVFTMFPASIARAQKAIVSLADQVILSRLSCTV